MTTSKTKKTAAAPKRADQANSYKAGAPTSAKSISTRPRLSDRQLVALSAAAKRDQPVWRRDDGSGPDIALVITDVGLVALGVEPTGAAAMVKATSAGASLVAVGAPRPVSKQAQLIAMLSSANGCSIDEAAAAFGWLPHTTRAALTGLRRKGNRIERAKGEAGAPSRHRIVASPAPDHGTEYRRAGGHYGGWRCCCSSPIARPHQARPPAAAGMARHDARGRGGARRLSLAGGGPRQPLRHCQKVTCASYSWNGWRFFGVGEGRKAKEALRA